MDKKFLAFETATDISMLNGHAFEEYLVQLFKDLGYYAEKTPGSGDFGADLILKTGDSKIAVQAKQFSEDVGFDAVKEIHFAKTYYETDEAWVICTSKFTKQAVAAAKKSDVKLFDGKDLEGLIAKAHAGERLAGSSKTMRELEREAKRAKKEQERAEKKAAAEKRYEQKVKKIRTMLLSMNRREEKRLSSMSNLKIAMEYKTNLGKQYMDLQAKIRKSAYSSDEKRQFQGEMHKLERTTKRAMFDYDGVPTIVDIAIRRFEDGLCDDPAKAIERFSDSEKARSYMNRFCCQAVRKAANEREERCLADIAEQDRKAQERKLQRQLEERKRMEQDARTAKPAVLELIEKLRAREDERIERLSPVERALEADNPIGSVIRELRKSIDEQQDRAKRLERYTDAYVHKLEAELERIDADLKEIEPRIGAAMEAVDEKTARLHELRGKLLSFLNKDEQARLVSEVEDLRRSVDDMQSKHQGKLSDWEKKSGELADAQAKHGELVDATAALATAEERLRQAEVECATKADSFVVPNKYDGLAERFEEEFAKDCVAAVEAYDTTEKVRAMAEASNQVALDGREKSRSRKN